MSTPTFDLVADAKAKSRQVFEGLTEPDEDIMPVMLWVGPHGPGLMPMIPMDDEHAKDNVATWMTATLAVAQATECVSINTAYMAMVPKDDPDVNFEAATVTTPVRERPDSTEQVVLMCMSRRGKGGGMIFAPVTRYPDRPPTLGEWTEMISEVGPGMSGRFGEAMALGLQIVREMPPDMAQIIGEGWKIGPEAVQNLVERFVGVARNYELKAMR
jgi:hypothetical protein